MVYTLARPHKRHQAARLRGRGANEFREHKDNKVVYFEKEVADVRNKVDTRKKQRACALGGLGGEELGFSEIPLSFTKFCGLPP